MGGIAKDDCAPKPVGVNTMLDHIMAELRYIRKRLDDHIDDEDRSYAAMKEELGSHRAKITGIVGGATIIIVAFVGWLFKFIPK